MTGSSLASNNSRIPPRPISFLVLGGVFVPCPLLLGPQRACGFKPPVKRQTGKLRAQRGWQVGAKYIVYTSMSVGCRECSFCSVASHVRSTSAPTGWNPLNHFAGPDPKLSNPRESTHPPFCAESGFNASPYSSPRGESANGAPLTTPRQVVGPRAGVSPPQLSSNQRRPEVRRGRLLTRRTLSLQLCPPRGATPAHTPHVTPLHQPHQRV
jgi:hypothetical protein